MESDLNSNLTDIVARKVAADEVQDKFNRTPGSVPVDAKNENPILSDVCYVWTGRYKTLRGDPNTNVPVVVLSGRDNIDLSMDAGGGARDGGGFYD